MKNTHKGFIATVILIVGLLIAIAGIYFYYQTRTPETLSSVGKTKLCKVGFQDCPSHSIYQCNDKNGEKIYRVEFGCTDLPQAYFDQNYEKIAECGGMPSPTGEQYKSSPLCDEISNCSETPIAYCQDM